MCILALIYDALPLCPVFILTNREESTERPSLAPHLSERSLDGVRWLGGTDGAAGGTWFGSNEYGLVAAITNRKKSNVPADVRSRGLLCRDVLLHRTAQQAVEWVNAELSRRAYAGFNLVIVSATAAWVIEAADELVTTKLARGIHCVGNSPLFAIEESRIARARRAVEDMLRASNDWKALIAPSQKICATHAEGGLQGICVHGNHWGTVSSTVLALPDDRADAVYFYAAGSPCRTPYDDYSAELRTLLMNRLGAMPPSE